MSDLNTLIEQAAEAWGGLAGPPVQKFIRENIVVQVTFAGGQKAALRLHREGYQTAQAIGSELLWAERLAEAGLPCPRPIRTLSGDLITQTGGPLASAVTWIDAPAIGAAQQVYGGTAQQQEQVYTRLGVLMARLHEQARAMDLNGITRPNWDAEALLGDSPRWGPFWDNPTLSETERNLIFQARDAARSHLADQAPEVLLIHADLLQENLLDDGETLWVIDFDDCGWGYAGYDLATALIQHHGTAQEPALRAALLAGYTGGDAAMTARLDADLPLYSMLRAMASAGWIVPRAQPDDPYIRRSAQRMMDLAQAYLAQA